MSGDPIVLAGDAGGETERLVNATARLADAHLGAHALIGGLAVMCRLAAVHRATRDVDTVTEATVPTAVEVIASSVGVADPSNANRVLVDGVKIDVIDTQSFEYEDLDGVDLNDRLFVVSHRWALETAMEAQVVAGDARATIRVAAPPALVAMKAGAVFGGRPRDPSKRASDLYDLYRLVLEFDRRGGIADSLLTSPFGLDALIAEALTESVVAQPERAVRWLRGGGPEMSNVSADDLRDVFVPLADRLGG